ncbi:hypothetical protein NKH77_29030 [Streptomyces sp. M19]
MSQTLSWRATRPGRGRKRRCPAGRWTPEECGREPFRGRQVALVQQAGARGRNAPSADSASPVSTLDRPGDGGEYGEALLVEEYDGVMLLRSPSDDTLSTSDVADLARVLAADAEHTATVVAGADAASTGELWSQLGEVLDSLRADGIGTVRLVMSAAGDDRPDEPAVARRIADAWGSR